MADEYLLDDKAWAAIEPLLPKIYAGARRKDDRRNHQWNYSCPAQRLPLEGLPSSLWTLHNGLQSLQSLERPRALAGDPRRSNPPAPQPWKLASVQLSSCCRCRLALDMHAYGAVHVADIPEATRAP